MSASREKKKRQEFLAGGGVDPKAVREAEEKAAAKKANTLYTILGIAFVVIAVALVVYNSGILQRSKVAVTIDGTEYNAAQVSYYYGGTYQNLLNTYGDYIAMVGLDPNQPLDSQPAWGTGEQTWDEYFKEQAVDSLKFVQAVLAKADAEGMKLEESDLEQYNSTIETMKTSAASNGYSYKAYLTAVYGSTMTPAVYEESLKSDLLASKYVNAYHDSITFTEDEVASYYEEHKNTYDLVDGAYVYVSGTPETKTDSDGNTVAATDEEKAAAMEAAKEKAEKILAAYKKGEDLEKLAEEYDATYSASEEMAYASSMVYGEWLFDEARKAGDTAVLEDETYSRYYVTVFNGRSKDESASTYNVRHVLIDETSLGLEEDTETTDELLIGKAQEVLDSWDGTEDGFAALANEHSTDSGSNTTGGLYEDVAQGQMVAEFENWCYEDGRKVGDTGIVGSSHGQHIMYFLGYGDVPNWYAKCETAMIDEEYSAWRVEMSDSVTAETQNGMSVVGF